MNFVDTNYLIRFFTQDVKKLAQKATKFLKTEKNIYITAVVVAETVYALEEHYKKDKVLICRNIESLLKKQNIKFEKHVLPALKMHKKETVGFYDCLIIAEAIINNGKLHTFDKKMQRVFKKYSKLNIL